MAAFIGPLIGAGIQFGLSKLNNPAKSPTFRRAEQIGDLSKNFAFDWALPTAEKAYAPVLDYYEKLLGGNRADMMSAVGPEVGAIADQYKQEKANIGKFTPGGGGQTSLLSQLPFAQSRDVTTLLEKVRPQAAQQLGALAGQITGEGLQGGALSLNAVSDQLNYLLGKAGQNNPLMQQAGAGVYQILQQMLGQSGGGGSSTVDETGGIWGGGWDTSGGMGGIPPNMTGGT